MSVERGETSLESSVSSVSGRRYNYQTLDYDIMLIKLFHPVEVTKAVAPISLPTGCPYGGYPCSVSGWGITTVDGESRSIGGTSTCHSFTCLTSFLVTSPELRGGWGVAWSIHVAQPCV